MTGQQLKNSILQMAVQGKLVPQDPNDEPASVLLERIRAEKEQLIKEGKIKKEKNPSVIFRGADNLPYEKIGKNEPVCIADEVPFDIPESWEWVRFKNLVSYNMGKTPPRKESEYWENATYPWVSIADLVLDDTVCVTKEHVNEHSAKVIFKNHISKAGTLLMSFKLTVGKVSILGMDAFHNEAIISIYPFCDVNRVITNYLFATLPLLSQNGNTKTAIKGATLNSDSLDALLIPVPPIKEQIRICEKIKALKNILSIYTNLEQSLTRLNDTFPLQLKKSILQYAIQGKLVPQDPADEPASALLERIRAEKEQFIKEGKIKRDKHESVIFRRDNSYYEKVDGIERCIDDELPFEIPESWEWCRLKSLTENITSGSRDWAKYYSTTGAAFLRMGNLSKNSFDLRLEHIQRVSIPSKAEGTRTSLQSGDLLFSITGDVGMLGLIPDGFEKAYINQHTAMIRFLPEMRNKYIPYLLLTDYAQKFYNANQHGIKNSFRLDSIGELLVSIPPEKELFRILQGISLVLSKIAVL